METVVKVSTQFICEATGKRVNLTSLRMSRAVQPDAQNPGGKQMDDISTDPSSPTTFQVDPENPSHCEMDESCGGMSFMPDTVL